MDGAPYLALDFVAAESFDVVIRDYGPAPVSEALRIATQLGGALDFAAAVNVFHGALHPRDVLVSTDETRVTGLGIAQALEEVGLIPPVRRPYTSPERLAGAAWDRRADVFSLAALVYEMLVGRRIAGIGPDAADAISPVANADLGRLRELFARALAEDPAERFETALAFANALHGAFSESARPAQPRTRRKREAGSVSARPTGARERLRLPLGSDDDLPLKPVQDEPLALRLDASAFDSPSGETPPGTAATSDAIGTPEPASYPELPMVHRSEGAGAETAPFNGPSDNGPSDPAFVGRFDVAVQAGRRAPVPEPAFEDFDLRLDATEHPLTDQDAQAQAEQDVRASTRPGANEERPRSEEDEERPRSEEEGATPREFADSPAEHPVDSEHHHILSAEASAAADPFAVSPVSPPHAQSIQSLSSAALEEGRSAIWPIALALVVGLLVGFAFGYGAGTRERPTSSPQRADAVPAAASPPAQASAADTQAALQSPAPAAPSAPAMSANPPAGERRATSPPPARSVPPAPAPTRAQAPPTAVSRPRTDAAGRQTAAGRLLVRSTPSGARVSVDGRDVGVTPLTLNSLARGTHMVRLSHQGYVAAERRVRISAAQPAQSIEVDLVATRAVRAASAPRPPDRTSGSVMVDSRPGGARVFVNGKLVGTTPLLLDAVNAGEHAVRLELDGFSPWTTTIRVASGERTRVSGSLER